MRVGEIGLNDGSFFVSFEGLFVAPERRQRVAAVEVRLGEFRFQFDSLLEISSASSGRASAVRMMPRLSKIAGAGFRTCMAADMNCSASTC